MRVHSGPHGASSTCVTTIVHIGAYSSSNNLYPVWVMIISGILGYILRKVDIPMAPIVLALVLGFMAEVNFRRAYIYSDGNLSIFLYRPIRMILIVFATLTLIVPIVRRYRKNVNHPKSRLITNNKPRQSGSVFN
jgi:putative tricarboxylic transport membrane protein